MRGPHLPPSIQSLRSTLRDAVTLRRVRVVLVVLVLLGVAPVATTFASYKVYSGSANDFQPAERIQPTDGITVVTVDGIGPGQLVAYAPNGTMLYHDTSYGVFHDVDPAPGGSATVEYVASYVGSSDRCAAARCSVSVVERANLTTGETERLWSRAKPDMGSDDVHDVDRVNDTVILVGDIAHPDSVYMVNVTSDEVLWRWNASDEYPRSAGGDYPGDFTHLNDVEYVENGPDGTHDLVMVSVRNMDQVVFIDPGHGVVDRLTLGADDRRETLYEQHNPDYIPAENGGPAIVVADSENNRIVEYQRRDGEWKRSWRWRDARMQWPRDADRLPNGHTLVTDTHADRVMELNERGKIVWSATFPGPYEAERLNTGPESTGGPSAARAGLKNHAPGGGIPTQVAYAFMTLVPPLVLHSALYWLPAWVTPVGATGLLFAGLALALWGAGEGVRAIVHARARRREAKST